MLRLFKEKLVEVISSVVPLILLVCVLQFTLVRAPTELFLQFLIGSLMIIAGLVLFFGGIDIGILPMGRFVGAQLPKKGSLFFIFAVSFVVGLVTTLAEPDVLVLSRQVDLITQGEVSRDAVLYSVALGVGLFVALAMMRILLGFRMVYLLTAAYLCVVALSFVAPETWIPLAYDAGSVTTGALTAPVVLSLAFGLSSVLANRSAISDGFGILGFASIGPVLIILIMGVLLS